MNKFTKLRRLTRARIISLALLGLFAHALFVSFTHHHIAAHDDSSTATASASSDGSGGSGTAPGSSSDSHCLSCRLQRNFNSSIHSASIILQLVPEALCREVPLAEPRLARSCLILASRAPPLT